MAVWSSAVQRLDIAQALFEDAPRLLTKALGTSPGKYFALKAPGTALDKYSDWIDLAIECAWEENTNLAHDSDRITAKYQDVGRWFVGIEAVYALVKAVSDGRFEVRARFDWNWIDSIAKAYGDLIMPSTQISPAAFLTEWAKPLGEAQPTARRFLDAAEAFKYLRFELPVGSSEGHKIDQVKYFGEGRRAYYGHTVGRLVIMRGASEYVNRGLILTRGHLNLLVEALTRVGNAYEHIAAQYSSRPATRDVMLNALKESIRVAGEASRVNSHLVARAYHKARGLSQWDTLRNEQDLAMVTEEAAFVMDKLNDVLDLAKYRAVANSLEPGVRADYWAIHKWMPPPDYDATAIFNEVRGWHMSTRPSGADPNASAEARDMWERVRSERKMNLAVAYRRRFNEWPSTLVKAGRLPTIQEVTRWDPYALFPYHQYGTDITGQIKDKVTVEDTAEAEVDRSLRSRSPARSFLLWFMENAGKVDTREDLVAFANNSLPEENFVRVAYKPEAHKPKSRLFYMAPPRIRILMGELEGNLSRVAETYPGSLQGKTSADKARIVQDVMDVFTEPPDVPDDMITSTYIVTFDLTKFSPRFNESVLRDYHAFWARVYARPEIESLARVGTRSKILHTTSNLIMSYENQGADLEGFRGRMMTMFHADLLAAACRLARERGDIGGKGVLSVFIDDGAVKVAVRGVGAEAHASANAFLRAMQEIYEAAGQENHPNKTCVSRVGGEMLADFYYNGQRLPASLKAAMRLAPDYENASSAISEDLSALFATSQGAVKDQGDWIQVYKRYVIACCMTIARWAQREATALRPVDFALKLLTPKSFGGFGLANLQMLVTTAGVNATAEGLGVLNRIGRYYRSMREAVARIVKVPIVARAPLAILRDPTRVRAAVPVIIENRLTMLLVKWLEENRMDRIKFLTLYRDPDLIDHATAVAIAILSRPVVSVPVLVRAWKCTPLHYVESVIGKFKRSATIFRLIGAQALRSIREKNRKDVQAVLSSWI